MALGSKVQKAIAAIKRPFMQYAEGFAKLSETRAELAPKFMKAFGLFQADEEGGSLADFVRQFDPSVPTESAEYRAHSTYMAADYLRRLRRKDKGDNRAKPVRSNLSAMGRLLALHVAVVQDVEAFWTGVEREFNLSKRQVGTLRKVVAVSEPLIRIPNIRPVRVKIVHVDPEEAQAAIASARSSSAAASRNAQAGRARAAA